MIDRLIDEQFLEKNEQTRYLKVTSKWEKVYFTNGKESLPGNGKESLLLASKQSLPYNNNIDTNKEDKDKISLSEKLKIKKDKFYNDLKAYQKDHPDKYPAGLYVKFIKYWTEESKNGKKIRLDDQPYFNIGKRLGTFWGFTKADERNELWKEHNEAKSKTELKLNL